VERLHYSLQNYAERTDLMQTLTVAEIAQRIRRPHEDMRSAGDRIRNWTREGLLTPDGEKHPGTGKVRRYPPSALMDAAFLQVITDCTGVAAVAAGELLGEARRIFARATKAGNLEDSMIVISKSVGESKWTMSHVTAAKLPAYLIGDQHDTHTVIGLKRLRDHINVPED
jgi:hypothetical protein